MEAHTCAGCIKFQGILRPGLTQLLAGAYIWEKMWNLWVGSIIIDEFEAHLNWIILSWFITHFGQGEYYKNRKTD